MVETSKTRSAPPKPTSKPATSRASASAASDEPAKKSSKLGWLLGWIVVPLLLLSALFFAGVHVGARHPQMGLSRATLWMFDREAQLGPQTEEDRRPMARRLWLTVVPRKEHSYEVDITDADVAEMAKATGLAPDEIDCAIACRELWRKKNPDREFLRILHCKGTSNEVTPGKEPSGRMECDAEVQR